jgi:hypothetical protein
MSQMGHSRRFEGAARTSASPPKPDISLQRTNRRAGPITLFRAGVDGRFESETRFR